jgi:hypothetical protein
MRTWLKLKKIFNFKFLIQLLFKKLKFIHTRVNIKFNVDDQYLQFLLTNTTDEILYINTVKFEPAEGYNLVDESSHKFGEEYTHAMLKKEKKRYLFKLNSKEKQKVYFHFYLRILL